MGIFDDEVLDSEILPEYDEGDDEEFDVEMTSVFRIKAREGKAKAPVKISSRSLEEQESINKAKNIAKRQAKN